MHLVQWTWSPQTLSLRCASEPHTPCYTAEYHNRFTAPFPGPPRWAGARSELLDFIVQGKINRGRHTDQPDGRHSIRIKQCPPLPTPSYTAEYSHWNNSYPKNYVSRHQGTVDKSWYVPGCWPDETFSDPSVVFSPRSSPCLAQNRQSCS